MAEWGNYLIPFMSKAPEYGYYVDQWPGIKPVKLDQTQVLDLFSYDYTWYGLNNTYNAKLFGQLNHLNVGAWDKN
jgi:hypothetical protein